MVWGVSIQDGVLVYRMRCIRDGVLVNGWGVSICVGVLVYGMGC